MKMIDEIPTVLLYHYIWMDELPLIGTYHCGHFVCFANTSALVRGGNNGLFPDWLSSQDPYIPDVPQIMEVDRYKSSVSFM